MYSDIFRYLPFMDYSLVVAKELVKLNKAMSHAKQDPPKWVDILESSDKTWSPGGGTSKPLQ